jgi:peptidoglycan/LPS O-acetylase OafA/YrhL
MPTQIKAESEARNIGLDGLRGIAALAVVFYHGILHMDLSMLDRVLYQPLQEMTTLRDAITKIALLIFNGNLAVYIFFVLSGCVLALSLNRRSEQPIPAVAIGFMLNRAARLYPPVIACMLLFWALKFLPIAGFPSFSLWQVVQNGSLAKITMHGPSSTVQAELLAAPFVLLAWLMRRYFGPLAVVLSLSYAALALESGLMVAFMPNMHAYLIAFVCGLVVAEPQVRTLVADIRPAYWWALIFVLLFCRAFHPQSSLVGLLVMTGLASALVAGILHGPKGGLSHILESRPIQALGRISFSFYLLNVPMLYLVWAFTDRWEWTRTYALESGLAVGAISAAMTWPLAVLSEIWVERPAIRAGRYVSRAVLRYADKNRIMRAA